MRGSRNDKGGIVAIDILPCLYSREGQDGQGRNVERGVVVIFLVPQGFRHEHAEPGIGPDSSPESGGIQKRARSLWRIFSPASSGAGSGERKVGLELFLDLSPSPARLRLYAFTLASTVDAFLEDRTAEQRVFNGTRRLYTAIRQFASDIYNTQRNGSLQSTHSFSTICLEKIG